MTARVGITAARRAAEQASLCRSLGLEPVLGPCIDVDRPADDARMLEPLLAAVDGGFDVAVVMTGVGARHVLAVAERHGVAARLTAQLDRSIVIARGAKARATLRRHGVRVDHIADPPHAAGVIARVERLVGPGSRVLVQSAGPQDQVVDAAVTRRGATPIVIRPYDIAAPPDDLPALDLVRRATSGAVAAVTFTSAHAVHGFAAIAERAEIDVLSITRRGVLVASVGPVTTAALREHGLAADVEPDVPRMGALYRAVAHALGRNGRSL